MQTKKEIEETLKNIDLDIIITIGSILFGTICYLMSWTWKIAKTYISRDEVLEIQRDTDIKIKNVFEESKKEFVNHNDFKSNMKDVAFHIENLNRDVEFLRAEISKHSTTLSEIKDLLNDVLVNQKAEQKTNIERKEKIDEVKENLKEYKNLVIKTDDEINSLKQELSYMKGQKKNGN